MSWTWVWIGGGLVLGFHLGVTLMSLLVMSRDSQSDDGLASPRPEGKSMLNRGRLAATAGVLFVALAVWPAHAAAGDGDIPDAVPCSGDFRVVTAVLTRVSAANRIVSVELFPPETAVNPGDGVLWLNTIPGAVVQVLFETTPPAAGKGVTMSSLPARPYASAIMEPGKASLLCFQTSGIFPYHVVIATSDSEIALRGVVVVGQ